MDRPISRLAKVVLITISGGLARSLPQRLFGYTQCCLNEAEKCDSHNRLLDLVSSNSFRSNPVAVAHFQYSKRKANILLGSWTTTLSNMVVTSHPNRVARSSTP